MNTRVMYNHEVGPLVRDWRMRRRRSQMDLALDVGMSPRHLSFVETGRSKPSPELLLVLADRLDVPLRERNQMLVAAGYAPRYPQTRLDDRAMARARGAVQRMLDHHDPYPGVAVDRGWNVVLANDSAGRLADVLPPHLAGPPLNVFRACLHPDGFAPMTENFAEWATYLLGELRRVATRTADPEIEALADEISAYPTVRSLVDWRQRPVPDEPTLLASWRIEIDGRSLSFFTTITSFGTPADITLSELAVELFYPADQATEVALTGRS
ncbi:MAG: putative transcriptional regulator [Acidimicrobiaceae bacterium]|nr:putative transcriptional regulator [Acidimicrobiaceae bacterium]